MLNFYLLISTFFVSIDVKFISCSLIGENQSESDYKLVMRPLSTEQDNQKFQSENDESWMNSFKNKEAEIAVLPEGTDVSSLESRNIGPKHSNSRTLSDDDVIKLLQSYMTHVENFRSMDDGNDEQFDWPVKFPQKRALTMLSRWNVFRIPNSIGGNGRHVIRSPFISKILIDPNASGKTQIKGRPFRWG